MEEEGPKIGKDGMRKTLEMKRGKTLGPDNIPVEVRKSLEELAVDCLTGVLNTILESERMPEKWKKSTLVPVF